MAARKSRCNHGWQQNVGWRKEKGRSWDKRIFWGDRRSGEILGWMGVGPRLNEISVQTRSFIWRIHFQDALLRREKKIGFSQLDHKSRGRGIPRNGETLPWRRLWSQINSELSALGREKAFLPLFYCSKGLRFYIGMAPRVVRYSLLDSSKMVNIRILLRKVQNCPYCRVFGCDKGTCILLYLWTSQGLRPLAPELSCIAAMIFNKTQSRVIPQELLNSPLATCEVGKNHVTWR